MGAMCHVLAKVDICSEQLGAADTQVAKELGGKACDSGGLPPLGGSEMAVTQVLDAAVNHQADLELAIEQGAAVIVGMGRTFACASLTYSRNDLNEPPLGPVKTVCAGDKTARLALNLKNFFRVRVNHEPLP
jgi:hypothetical protein